MPNEIIETPKEKNSVQSQEKTLSILLQKVTGQDTMPNLTREQVDEVLSQRREVTGFIHDDRKRESYDFKFVLITTLIFIFIFSLVVLWIKPDIFSEVLSLIVGLLGGYGFGRMKK